MDDKNTRKFITFYRRHKRMPGYQEIMDFTGYRSKNAVFKFIERLAEDGYVSKDAQGRLIPKKMSEGVRLLGLIEAGFPSAAEEELLDVMNFDEYLTPNKEASYILRVKGDSMIEEGICDGDMVVVEKRQTYKPGQIVIASIDGEFTIKFLRTGKTGYYLEPANAKYKPIYPKETLNIEAVVTAVVRKY